MAEERFSLDQTMPKRIFVIDTTPINHATRLYAVVADHIWAQRIIAGNCYLRDANDIAYVIGAYLHIPVVLYLNIPVSEVNDE